MKSGLSALDIERINRKHGGVLRLEGSIEYAIAAGKDKTDRQKLALLWRAILVDHPFSDGNKRTVEILTRRYARAHSYKINTPRLVREIIDVSKNSITDLDKIERRIKYACTGD